MKKREHLVGLTILFVFIAAVAMAAEQVYTGADGNYNSDTWNVNANWNEGGGNAPKDSDSAVVETNHHASAKEGPLDAYTLDLTMRTNATITVGSGASDANRAEAVKVLGTPGSTTIYVYDGARFVMRMGNSYSYVVPRIVLRGDLRDWSMSRSTTSAGQPDFNYEISGPYTFTLNGSHGSDIADFNASNSFAHLLSTPQYGDGNINANVPGSLGSGDVTIEENPSSGKRCMKLTINATNTMDDSCILTINGPMSTDRITMNGDDTIAELFLDYVRQDHGTYGRIGNTNVDYECVWFLGDGILTVTGPTLSYWDTNSTTAGAGGSAPAGTWDAANTYWNASSNGTGSTAAWNPGDMAAFAAGTDASGTYTVTVSSVQDVTGVYFEEGDVTLSGGSLRMTGQSYFNVADGLTATFSTVVTNDATAWTFTKGGDGTLVPTVANTYTGPTRIEGGTMVISNLQNAGVPSLLGAYPDSSPDGLVFAGGGTLKYTGGSTNIDRGLHMQGDGTINIVNDDTALTMSTSMSSQIEGTLTVTGGSGSSFAMGKLTMSQGVGVTLKPIGISMTMTSIMGQTEYPYPSTDLVFSGTSTGNVVTGDIWHDDVGQWSRPVDIAKRGSSTWTIDGRVIQAAQMYVYEGTLILTCTNNSYDGRTLVYGGTVIIEADAWDHTDGALGYYGNTPSRIVELGVEAGGADATFLVNGPYEMARVIEIPTDDPTDDGGRTITIGGTGSYACVYSGNVLLADDATDDVAWGLNLTADSGGTVTMTAPILEYATNATLRSPIRKVGEGTVVFACTNDYEADTHVDAGTLSLASNETLYDASALYVTNGAIVNIGSGVDETVADLYLSGRAAFHGYTYGGTNSAADFKLSDWFTGTGVITLPGARDGSCSVTNTAATGIGPTSATFNASITFTGISTDVYVHWGPTDGSNDLGVWSNSVLVGTWTSVFSKAISFTTNGLSSDTTYYYTFRATNSFTNIWATPSISFTTLGSVEVTNTTTTAETDVSSTIRGRLVDGSVALAWICWGDEDGGTDSTGDWDNVVSMGTVTEAADFTTLASGLTPNVTYWYRCYATNALGDDWSDTAASFSGVPINPGNGGSVAIYTHSVTEEGVLNPEDTEDPYDLTWNTIVRQSAEYELDYSGRVNVTAVSGHHLVLHNARYSTGRNGNGRIEAHHYILVDGEPQAIGWASGYADCWQDRQDVISSGGGIIYLPSSATIAIQADRTDSEAEDDVDRIAYASGLQIVKLDSTWDYCRLSKNAAQVGPVSTTYVDVEYGTQDEVDSGSFIHTNGTADIILKTPGHYLVFANTYVLEDGDNQNIRQRLTLNGTMVDGSLTGQHIKNDSDCDEGAATLGMIVETSSSNEVLNVEVAMRENCVVPSFIMPDKTAVTIARLPDDGDYIRLHNENVNTITNFNNGTTLAMDWDTADELDAGGFSGSYANTNSVITTTANADYLFLTTLFDDNPTGDATFWQRWSTNGVSDPLPYAAGGDCTQGDDGGGYSGLIVWMESNSTLQVVSESVSYTGSQGIHNGYSCGLWGMRLESVIPKPSIANLAPTEVDYSQAKLNGQLYAPGTNYDVYVHWGLTDGGSNHTSWTRNAYVGSWTNVDWTNISYLAVGLIPNSTNYYTFRATNDSGEVWASPSWRVVPPGDFAGGTVFRFQ